MYWGQGDLRKEDLTEEFPKVYLQQLKKYKVSFERKSCKRIHAVMRYKMLESSGRICKKWQFPLRYLNILLSCLTFRYNLEKEKIELCLRLSCM